ncbi:unnamed protein product [Oikopleura dioica]|uniref:EGF-like domain-containing protein n=1 Tax=Oikopleura dioica TaxID=34765 RepID=E4XCF3_OIKDI|nr:unnamed protein product [Oikopleura dioica]
MKLIQSLLGSSFAYLSCEDKDCGENAICQESFSRDWFFMSEPSCQCLKGFVSSETSPDGALNCVDINECDLGYCHATQDCFNVKGGFQCTCKDGYVENRNLLTFEYAPCKSVQLREVVEVRKRRQSVAEGSGEIVEETVVVVETTLGTDVEWVAGMDTPGSEAFQTAAAEVENDLIEALNPEEGTEIEVTGFSQDGARKRRSTGGVSADVEITIPVNEDETDTSDSSAITALVEEIQETIVASLEAANFTVEAIAAETETETTFVAFTGECDNFFEANPEIFNGPGIFRRKGVNWTKYHKISSNGADWKIPEGTKFTHECKPKSWNPAKDIAFMCDSDDKIKICKDEFCGELTDRELEIEKAAWRFNCGKESVEEESGGDCGNIFEKFSEVFDDSGNWKWYQEGWKRAWNVDLAELEELDAISYGTVFTHQCDKRSKKWRKKDIAFKCARVDGNDGFFKCKDRKCETVQNKMIRPKNMSWRFNCEE